jgi:hypothetical protein
VAAGFGVDELLTERVVKHFRMSMGL